MAWAFGTWSALDAALMALARDRVARAEAEREQPAEHREGAVKDFQGRKEAKSEKIRI